MVNRRHELVGVNRDAQFFFNFAHDRFFGGFALLHFAAGEFPAVFVFAVAALCGKNFAVFDNDGGNDFNGLHCVCALLIMGNKYTC